MDTTLTSFIWVWKQAISSPDQSILRALEILLTDYVQRGRQAKLDAERLT